MLDIQYIRDNPEIVAEKSKQKGYEIDVAMLLELDKKRRSLLLEIETERAAKNEHAARIGKEQAKPSADTIEKGKKIKERLAKLEAELEPVESELNDRIKAVPNMPLDEVPVGKSEDDNVVVEEVGEKPVFDFEPKTHWEIGQAKGWIDKERAAKVAGARFAYIKGDLVRLQWALMQFALDHITDPAFIEQVAKDNNLDISYKPFVPVLPPLMIKTEVYDNMDRLEPRDDRYKIEGEELWLQGSAEHVLGSMHQDEIFSEDQLPVRYAGFATSFRKEAGTYGKDTEGIIRMHQFDKLEMESLSTPATSYQEHLLMLAIQEYLMKKLGVPYRLINKCTADIGKPNARGWDIDAWMPGQNQYRETHTADYMTDYQSRRLHTKFRRTDGETALVHTADATVFSQRPLIAIVENYQTREGNVMIPDALRPYMGEKGEI